MSNNFLDFQKKNSFKAPKMYCPKFMKSKRTKKKLLTMTMLLIVILMQTSLTYRKELKNAVRTIWTSKKNLLKIWKSRKSRKRIIHQNLLKNLSVNSAVIHKQTPFKRFWLLSRYRMTFYWARRNKRVKGRQNWLNRNEQWQNYHWATSELRYTVKR